jgi:hypothetical protein
MNGLVEYRREMALWYMRALHKLTSVALLGAARWVSARHSDGDSLCSELRSDPMNVRRHSWIGVALALAAVGLAPGSSRAGSHTVHLEWFVNTDLPMLPFEPSADVPVSGTLELTAITPPPSTLTLSGWYESAPVDAFPWCVGSCGVDGSEADALTGILAELYISPYPSPDPTDVEFDLYFQCGDAFSFAVDGVTPAIPTCAGPTGEVDETYIYSKSGVLISQSSSSPVPEPDTGVLAAAALGLLAVVTQAARTRRRRAGVVQPAT